MDAVSEKSYRCSPRVLLPGLLRARSGWRSKTRELRVTVKNLKRRVSDVSESRDGWKERARAAEAGLANSERELTRLKAEQETLRHTLADALEKKWRSQTTC